MRSQLRRFAKSLVRKQPIIHWQGVYDRAAAVPSGGAGFAGEPWIQAAKRDALVAATPESRVATPTEAQLLATLVAGFPHRVRVLDFGGGMGIGFLWLRAALAAPVEVTYEVVEGERICAEGRAFVPEVTFRTELPGDDARYDIVFACSSLQYVDDERAMLARFASYQPRYILLADVPACAGPGFWTAQTTISGSRIPYHFMSVDDLVAPLAAAGYTLCVRGMARTLQLGPFKPPSKIDRSSHLLFARRTP